MGKTGRGVGVGDLWVKPGDGNCDAYVSPHHARTYTRVDHDLDLHLNSQAYACNNEAQKSIHAAIVMQVSQARVPDFSRRVLSIRNYRWALIISDR